MIPAKFEANERIREKQLELGLVNGDRLPFLCECDDVACRDIVRLTTAEYNEARSGGEGAIVAPGHPYTP